MNDFNVSVTKCMGGFIVYKVDGCCVTTSLEDVIFMIRKELEKELTGVDVVETSMV